MAFHKWIGEDEGYVSCLHCGGMWEDTNPDDVTTDSIRSASGAYPSECTSTSSVHGYRGERYCHEHDSSDRDNDDYCEDIRETDNCNCLFCDS